MTEETERTRRFVASVVAADDPQTRQLVSVLTTPAGLSSAGYPYLVRSAWESFRDEVAHLFTMGGRVLETVARVEAALPDSGLPPDDAAALERAIRVIRQVVKTAAVTAPPDLWLLRLVLGGLASLGLTERLLRGEALYPESCSAEGRRVNGRELEIDLHFLLARGIVEQYDNSYRVAGHPTVARLLTVLEPLGSDVPASAAQVWRRLFAGEALAHEDEHALQALGADPPRRTKLGQTHWVPAPEEVDVGFRLVPLVLGLRACDLSTGLRRGDPLTPEALCRARPDLAACALRILTAAGWLSNGADGGAEPRVTELGARGFARAPGPFGIIETYHPYMSRARDLLLEGDVRIWVRRGENVSASQDANRGSFERANDALDRFCRDTGFTYDVFIEHAIGRGEATRQRFERSGASRIRYFGADLEDAAIDAAVEEQRSGRLPRNMVFVRNADIGRPAVLLNALRDAGADPHGAVMMVGNGFHEVRDQTDERMVDVFSGYQRAGVVLIFTEENALSIDDLRATAWNTYHAGFKYVHEKSGQGLRPAEAGPVPRLGHELRAPWRETAARAGYVRADPYSSRTRTIYPYPRADGHNPPISVNHFFVPGSIAARLGIEPD